MASALDAQADRSALGVDQLISLLELAKLIARESSLDGLIDRILADSRPWIGADACSLFLPDPEAGDLVIHSAQGGGCVTHGEIRVPMGAGIVGAAMRQREAVRVDDVSQDPRFFAAADRQTGYETRALIAVPLLDGAACRGVIEFVNPVGRACFSAVDVTLAEYFAALVSSALHRIEMAASELRHVLQERDLGIAFEVQRGLLPRSFALGRQLGGLDLCGVSDPALQVGGDLYDFFPGPAGQLYFLIGDVSGKGVGAGMFMAQTRALVRVVARSGGSPAQILEEVNEFLYPDNEAVLFVTMILGCYRPETAEIEYAQAGHNRAIRCSLLAGPAYEPSGGMALGPFPAVQLPTFRSHLDPGDCLILYTDGVTEAMNAQEQCYGDDRLLRFLQVGVRGTASQIVEALRRDVAAFAGAAEQSDDITILVLRRPPLAE